MNRRIKDTLRELRTAAANNHLSLSSEEVLRNGAIGLDGVERKLLYLDRSGDQSRAFVFDLHELESCSLNVNYRNIAAGDLEHKNVEDFIDSIFLRCTGTDIHPVEIPFYDCRDNFIFELPPIREKAYKWKEIISQLLETKLETRA